MSDNNKRKPFWLMNDFEEGTGNIWGWKFSNYGMIFMGILIVIAVYRHIAMDVPFEYKPPTDEHLHPFQINAKADTTKLDGND